jgi:hypothetical protein
MMLFVKRLATIRFFFVRYLFRPLYFSFIMYSNFMSYIRSNKKSVTYGKLVKGMNSFGMLQSTLPDSWSIFETLVPEVPERL